MGRGGRSGFKRGTNQHVRVKNNDSEDSDDDYVAEVDEVDERSDELELESLVGDTSEEESSFHEEEEEEDEEEEDECCIAKKPRARKTLENSRRNRIKSAKKRRKFTRNMDEDFVEDEDEFTSDEEFTPDEMESLEEEEEVPLPRLKTKKRRTTMSRKSSAKKRRGKTDAKTVRKPVKKKRIITRSFRKKEKTVSDDDLVETGPTLRNRSTKKPVLRKKRGTVLSDSESFEPSDYEFTISEEEREQLREANVICEALSTNLRSSRRIQGNEVSCELRKTLVRKGKEKADETNSDVGKPVCGICFTEEGKNTIRGTLNCCSHYFCFGCIMEWSKVESRCPFCKQRFVTISKPSRCVKGFDLRNVVIQVPERDQVYQPSEEELRDFLNPYENVICTECNHGGDDDLMLLCDLCDSPAHTFCVGLGREVPEGNWYCHGCRPGSQTLDPTPNQRQSSHASYENMADIDLNVSIPETPLSQGNASPRYSGGSFRAPSPTSGMAGVTTVSSRRRMQHQIYRFLFDRSNQGADVNNLRSLLGVEINSRFQHSGVTDAGTSRNAHHVDRLQESVRASSSAEGLARTHTRWSGSDRINSGFSHAQMSTSGSSFGPTFHGTEESTNMVKQRVLLIVRRQLKSMSRDMNLSDENYEEISRRTTETIMVAYGLEPPRLDSCQVQVPFCVHVGNAEMGPIDGCCLTCFENFAKHIVNMIMDITLRPHWSRSRH